MTIVKITKAPQAYNLLNGIVCLYKDRFMHVTELKDLFRSKLARDLNKYEVRPVRERVVIEGSIEDENLTVSKDISYADHPLVVGPRYKMNDIEMRLANYIDTDACGLVVAGIGTEGVRLADILAESNFVRTFEVKGMFGRATSNFFDDGKTIEKSTWKHIKRSSIDYILSKIVSMHQKMMFKTVGVDLNTQDAYELAAMGPTRPMSEQSVPLIYSLKCTSFKAPEFAVRLQTINEDATFIGELVNGVGIKAHSNAYIKSLRCTRYGHFTIESSLLEKEWNVKNVLSNIASNVELTSEEKLRPLEANIHSPSKSKNLMEVIEDNKDKFKIVNNPKSLGHQ